MDFFETQCRLGCSPQPPKVWVSQKQWKRIQVDDAFPRLYSCNSSLVDNDVIGTRCQLLSAGKISTFRETGFRQTSWKHTAAGIQQRLREGKVTFASHVNECNWPITYASWPFHVYDNFDTRRPIFVSFFTVEFRNELQEWKQTLHLSENMLAPTAASPSGGLRWTRPRHFCQRVFLGLMQIEWVFIGSRGQSRRGLICPLLRMY